MNLETRLRNLQGQADCRRRTVAAVVYLPDGTVLGEGWNSLPSGSCTAGQCPRGLLSYAEQPKDVGYAASGCAALHAEERAIQQAGLLARGACIAITEQPCPGCAALLSETGISEILVIPLSR